MVRMDVPQPETAVKEAFRVVKPGRFFQCSITHPCFAPPFRKVIRENGQVKGFLVSDDFEAIDGRVDARIFGDLPVSERPKHPLFRIPRYHRTLSQWTALCLDAGWTLRGFGEPKPTPRWSPALDDGLKGPLFLHVLLRKA